ncbi:response regulator [Geothrix sp.]|jgi:two-component system response regulator PilR (NtrC family)|uniref:response regulator n=1 Tax=Geothrix sp. TaxID=1962974 RepID=UPI0025BDB088|nr:response regulator [Geothrix sp.]
MVLIVEDNQLFRRYLRDSLSRHFPDLSFYEAENLAQGRQRLRETRPEAVLVDLCLPDGTGLDLVETIHRDYPEIPVAICTAHDLPEYREAARKAGLDAFFVKNHLDWEGVIQLITTSRYKSMRQACPPPAPTPGMLS